MFALPPIESLYSSSKHKGALSFSFSLLSRSHSRHKITDIIDVSSINLLFVALSLGMLKHDQVQMSKNVSKCWNLKKGGWVFSYVFQPTLHTHYLYSLNPSFYLCLHYIPTLIQFNSTHTHIGSKIFFEFFFLSLTLDDKSNIRTIKKDKKG